MLITDRIRISITGIQGCGLGLDVSILKRSRDVPASRLEENCQRLGSRLGLGRQTYRSRPFTSHAQVQCIKFPDGHADGAVCGVNGL